MIDYRFKVESPELDSPPKLTLAYPKRMPKQKPHRSEQVVGTPLEFMSALEQRFGKMDWDLAATAENTKASKFIAPEQDSLKQNWMRLKGEPGRSAFLFCNPPYGDIEPWVQKAANTDWTCKQNDIDPPMIYILIPASVGSVYWKEYIHGKCNVYFLSPRIKFIGHKHAFPRDLVLLEYGTRFSGSYSCWRWDGK